MQSLGQIAVERKLITADQLDHALAIQKTLREVGIVKRIGDILVLKGWVQRAQVDELLLTQGVETEKEKSEIGGYRLLSRLGRGGMSTVFKALQVSMDRIVALKVLSPRMHDREEVVRRFKREAQLLGRLSHPNIVYSIEVDDCDGYLFFAMEHVEGQTLKEILDSETSLDVEYSLKLTRQIADALGYLWSHNIVHGDLKPGNIIVSPEGTAKIFDLGLAIDYEWEDGVPMEKGKVYGTSYYVAPEQITGAKDLDVRTDIYALGITLYSMLTGNLPFRSCSRAIVMNKHLIEPIRWPIEVSQVLPGSVMNLVTRMAAKERAERFQTTQELVEEIDRILAGRSVHTQYLPIFPERHFVRMSIKPRHPIQRRTEAVSRVIKTKGLLDRYLAAHPGGGDYRQRLERVIPASGFNDSMKKALFLLMEGRIQDATEILLAAHKNGYELSTILNCIAAVQSPPDMVYIPSGPFMMGSDHVPEEAPAHEVYLKSYYMDEGLVTNVRYFEFVEATGAAPPKCWGGAKRPGRNVRDLPVTTVSFNEAHAFARWAGKRLPTEAEWEKAARGPSCLLWPWGTKWVDGRCNCARSDDGRPSVVGKYTAGISAYGCYDMAGNVMEWTVDDFAPYPGNEGDRGRFSPGQKVVRGGCYLDRPEDVRCAARRGLPPESRLDTCGFRCVKDVPFQF